MAVTASAIAGTYAAVPGVFTEIPKFARCLVRSQLGYVAGDTRYSYVVGFGDSFPQQVHHRDACCTLEEDAAGDCGGEKCASAYACCLGDCRAGLVPGSLHMGLVTPARLLLPRAGRTSMHARPQELKHAAHLHTQMREYPSSYCVACMRVGARVLRRGKYAALHAPVAALQLARSSQSALRGVVRVACCN